MSDHIKREYDEWCTDCKEYDKERHCCPRWNKVIRDTMDEIRQNAEKNWDKVEVVRCKDCVFWEYNCDGDFNIQYGYCRCRHWENEYEIETTGGDYCSYGERAEA